MVYSNCHCSSAPVCLQFLVYFVYDSLGKVVSAWLSAYPVFRAGFGIRL